MNKAMKKRWITALRSGEYQQARDKLQGVDGSMCCLGVLCDIEIDGDWELCNDRYTIQGRGGNLPFALIAQSGLSIEDRHNLMTLNDVEERSFDEIANFIKAHL